MTGRTLILRESGGNPEPPTLRHLTASRIKTSAYVTFTSGWGRPLYVATVGKALHAQGRRRTVLRTTLYDTMNFPYLPHRILGPLHWQSALAERRGEELLVSGRKGA